MPELVILRHGNTFDKGDVVRRVGARSDLALSSSGLAQADNVGAVLAEKYGAFTRIFAAPLRRTQQTAASVARACRFDGEIETNEMLTEIDYGPDEGKPEADVIARLGEAALNEWDESSVPPTGWLVDPVALTQAWRAFFERLAGGAGPVLAVTSNGIARFALAAAAIHSGEFDRKLKTAAYGVLNIDAEGRAVIIAWNDR